MIWSTLNRGKSRTSSFAHTGEPDKEQYSKYVRNHHPAIVSEEVWEAVQLRFKRSNERHYANVSDVAEREEDGRAMAEDWCGP